MYAKGMTTHQISDTLQDIYGFEASEGFISDVTDKILSQIEEWQNRPYYYRIPDLQKDFHSPKKFFLFRELWYL